MIGHSCFLLFSFLLDPIFNKPHLLFFICLTITLLKHDAIHFDYQHTCIPPYVFQVILSLEVYEIKDSASSKTLFVFILYHCLVILFYSQEQSNETYQHNRYVPEHRILPRMGLHPPWSQSCPIPYLVSQSLPLLVRLLAMLEAKYLV